VEWKIRDGKRNGFMLSREGTWTYRIEIIDVWDMHRTEILTGVSGEAKVELPSREGMAVPAVRMQEGGIEKRGVCDEKDFGCGKASGGDDIGGEGPDVLRA
jgi:hypothetical protein